MAHPGGTSARAHRLIGLVASGLLAVTTALAFARVFAGGRATLVLLATAIASAAIAVAFERRSLLLATLASALGVAVAVGLVVFPDTTWFGVPTMHTLSAALDAAGTVGEQARIQIAPAEPIAPLLLAAAVSLWAAIFSAHALAFRAGSPLLGLIPPVALVAFADTVLEQFVKPLYGLAFLAAALLVVFADGLSRVQGWGPVWTSSRRGVAATAGRGARRLAATALGAGLIAPVIVPGFGSRAVIDFGSTLDDSSVSVDPFVSVQNQLTQGTPVPVLRVRGSDPMYLRLLALPSYDGQGWRHDPDATGLPLGADGIVAPPPLAAEPVRMQFDVLADLTMPWVPAPYPMTHIDIERTVSYDGGTGTTLLDVPLRSGEAYTATAAIPEVTADDLRAIEARPGFGEFRSDDPYLALPVDTPTQLERIAEEWTRGAGSVFDQALAIQDRLSDETRFAYDPDARLGSGPGTILTFLQRARAGFCQQFAASMAVLLRELNIPSRVVVGYSSAVGGPPRPDGTWIVTSDRAHAWVEVLFPGVGWMPFEPTPNRANPVVLGYDPADEGGPGTGGGTSGAPNAGRNRVGPGQQGLIDPTPPLPGGPTGIRGGGGSPDVVDEPAGVTGRGALVVALLLAGVGFLLLPVVRAARRGVRLRRAAAEPRRSILATYDAFTEQVAGVGLARSPGETLEEYRRRVLETGYLSDGHLDRLTTIATAAAYSGREPGHDDARAATAAAGTAVAEIRRAVGPARWLTGLYRRT